MNDMKSIRFPPPVADDMIRAILDGRKKVTRRVVKPQPREIYHGGTLFDDDGDLIALAESQNGRLEQSVDPYRPGDILYVRETWRKWIGGYSYKADAPWASQWRSSTNMPREAARLFLRVTDVRVERLQQIMERGTLSAQAEGFVNDIDIINGGGKSATKHFSEFWNSDIKKPADRALYGWKADPWVWVIEFERCKKPKEVW